MVQEVSRLAFTHFYRGRVHLQNREAGEVLIKSPFGIPSQMVTPRNVVKATCMMEDAHVASWPDGRLAGPVAQIHLFASIYQENELFIRILARSDADSGGRRSERQKRFVNGEFIDGVMSMHRTPTAIRFFKAAIS